MKKVTLRKINVKYPTLVRKITMKYKGGLMGSETISHLTQERKMRQKV